jgi:hypothetical protein
VLASQDGTGAVWWGLADQEGTIRDVVSNTGVVRDTGRTSAAVDFIFGYTGRPWDAAGETDSRSSGRVGVIRRWNVATVEPLPPLENYRIAEAEDEQAAPQGKNGVKQADGKKYRRIAFSPNGRKNPSEILAGIAPFGGRQPDRPLYCSTRYIVLAGKTTVALPSACLISTGAGVAMPLMSNSTALVSRGLATVTVASVFSTWNGALPAERMRKQSLCLPLIRARVGTAVQPVGRQTVPT